jgi:hypothetical protein
MSTTSLARWGTTWPARPGRRRPGRLESGRRRRQPGLAADQQQQPAQGEHQQQVPPGLDGAAPLAAGAVALDAAVHGEAHHRVGEPVGELVPRPPPAGPAPLQLPAVLEAEHAAAAGPAPLEAGHDLLGVGVGDGDLTVGHPPDGQVEVVAAGLDPGGGQEQPAQGQPGQALVAGAELVAVLDGAGAPPGEALGAHPVPAGPSHRPLLSSGRRFTRGGGAARPGRARRCAAPTWPATGGTWPPGGSAPGCPGRDGQGRPRPGCAAPPRRR